MKFWKPANLVTIIFRALFIDTFIGSIVKRMGDEKMTKIIIRKCS